MYYNQLEYFLLFYYFFINLTAVILFSLLMVIKFLLKYFEVHLKLKKRNMILFLFFYL